MRGEAKVTSPVMHVEGTTVVTVSAQHPAVIDAGFAVIFWEKGSRQAICGSISQEVSDIFDARISNGELRTPAEIKRSLSDAVP